MTQAPAPCGTGCGATGARWLARKSDGSSCRQAQRPRPRSSGLLLEFGVVPQGLAGIGPHHAVSQERLAEIDAPDRARSQASARNGRGGSRRTPPGGLPRSVRAPGPTIPRSATAVPSASQQSWSRSGASIPNSRTRSPPTSIVSPSITRTRPSGPAVARHRRHRRGRGPEPISSPVSRVGVWALPGPRSRHFFKEG